MLTKCSFHLVLQSRLLSLPNFHHATHHSTSSKQELHSAFSVHIYWMDNSIRRVVLVHGFTPLRLGVHVLPWVGACGVCVFFRVTWNSYRYSHTLSQSKDMQLPSLNCLYCVCVYAQWWTSILSRVDPNFGISSRVNDMGLDHGWNKSRQNKTGFNLTI